MARDRTRRLETRRVEALLAGDASAAPPDTAMRRRTAGLPPPMASPPAPETAAEFPADPILEHFLVRCRPEMREAVRHLVSPLFLGALLREFGVRAAWARVPQGYQVGLSLGRLRLLEILILPARRTRREQVRLIPGLGRVAWRPAGQRLLDAIARLPGAVSRRRSGTLWAEINLEAALTQASSLVLIHNALRQFVADAAAMVD